MPVKVRKKRKDESGKAWKIVEVETGKVVAESTTKKKAAISAAKRNEAYRKKMGRT